MVALEAHQLLMRCREELTVLEKEIQNFLEYVISKKRLMGDCWVTDSLASDCKRYLCGRQTGDHLWFEEEPLHSDTEEADEG